MALIEIKKKNLAEHHVGEEYMKKSTHVKKKGHSKKK